MSQSHPSVASIEENSMCPCYEFSARDKTIKDLLNSSENIIQRVTTSLDRTTRSSSNPSPGAPRVHLHAPVASLAHKHLPNKWVWDRKNYIFTQQSSTRGQREGAKRIGSVSSAEKIARGTKNPPTRKILMGERRGNWLFMPSKALFPLRQSERGTRTKIIAGKVVLDESWADILTGKSHEPTYSTQLVACDQFDPCDSRDHESTQTETLEESEENLVFLELSTNTETANENTEAQSEASTGKLDDLLNKSQRDEEYNTEFEPETSSSSNKNSNWQADATSTTRSGDNSPSNSIVALPLENNTKPEDAEVRVNLTTDSKDIEECDVKLEIAPQKNIEMVEESASSASQSNSTDMENMVDSPVSQEEDHLNQIFEEMLRTVNSRVIPRSNVNFRKESHTVIEENNPREFSEDKDRATLENINQELIKTADSTKQPCENEGAQGGELTFITSLYFTNE